MSALGDVDDLIELGIEGFDKLADKGFDHLPDDAMHANFYHPRRLKSLKNIGRSKKNKSESPSKNLGDEDRDIETDRSGPQEGGNYPPQASQDYVRPPHPYHDEQIDPAYRTWAPRDRNAQARYRPTGPPVTSAMGQARGSPPPYNARAAASFSPVAYAPNLYRPPSGHFDPPSPYASSVGSNSEAERKPRRRRRKHRKHRSHYRQVDNPDSSHRHRSISPSRTRAAPRPGPPRRRASSLDAFDRPPRGSESLSPPPSMSHERSQLDLWKEGKRPIQNQFFSQSKQALGASALGAIAGGWAAREAQVLRGSKMPGDNQKQGKLHSKGKDQKGERLGGHNWMITLVGAAAGGLGANALMERKQNSERKDREWKERRRGSWAQEGSAVGSGGGSGKRAMTIRSREVDDSEDEYWKKRKSFGDGYGKGEARY